MIIWEKHFKFGDGEEHCYLALLCKRGYWELRQGFMGRFSSQGLREEEAIALVGEKQAELARANSAELSDKLDELDNLAKHR